MTKPKSPSQQIPAKKVRMIWSVVAGIFAAFFFLSIGYVIEKITNTPFSLVEDNIKTLLGVISYSASFGYWLGHSFSSENPSQESVFFSSMFGTFTALLAIIIFFEGELLFLIAFPFSVLFPLFLIKSGVIDLARFAFLKEAISVFSEQVSLLISIYYFVSWYLSKFSDALTANIVGIVIAFVFMILYVVYKEKIIPDRKLWKEQ
ncbi:hypothetical protein MUP77_17115 [Candidatus Bathyarchaeota archaeon]|nr:hypothetical protein [Candidatus Bathyarchaeota archaeon]